MAPQPLTELRPLDLDRKLLDEKFLDGDGAVALEIAAHSEGITPALLTAPVADTKLNFAEITLKGKANADIRFLGNGTATFKGTGSAYAGIAINPDPAALLGPMEVIGDTGFSLTADAANTFAVLRWGANADATANGSLALASAPGATLTFDAQGHGEALSAVVCELPRTATVVEVLEKTVLGWRLPVHIRSAADLMPGTHIIAEAGGSIALQVAAQFGHDFNWIRRVQVGADEKAATLKGDVGLKLQLGLQAAVNLKAQGKFAIVVSRESLDESSKQLRVRVFKLKMNGFGCALSANAVAQGSQTVLPEDYRDLVKAVLGTHGLQVLKDIETWTDPAKPLPQLLADAGEKYTNELLISVTGKDLDQAKAMLTNLIAKWNTLPHTTASMIFKLVEQGKPLDEIGKVAGEIANAQDVPEAQQVIRKLLDDTGVFRGAGMQWLESLAPEGVMALVREVEKIPQVKTAATVVNQFLSEKGLEDLLGKLQKELEARTGLGAIDALTKDNFAGADKLLMTKLTAFLAKQPVFQEVDALRKKIHELMGKAQPFYEKALKAIGQQYNLQFNAAWERTTTGTALMDVKFDDPAPDNPAGQALKKAIAGDFADILAKVVPGVTLAHAALSHGVKRTASASLTLPLIEARGDWINESLAKYDAMDVDNGRIVAYDLNAQDTNVVNRLSRLFGKKNFDLVTLAVTAHIPEFIQGSGIAVHPRTEAEKTAAATAMYSIRTGVKNMKRADLEHTLQPFATTFLPKVFSDGGSVQRWVGAGKLLETPGNTLVSMDVTIPSAPLVWLRKAPEKRKDALYLEMSRTIQERLRQLIPFLYLGDPSKFDATQPASVMLLYKSMPAANSIKIEGETITPTKDDLYWDPRSQDQFDLMTRLAKQGRFGHELSVAETRLRALGMDHTAGFYGKDSLDSRFHDAVTLGGTLSRDNVLGNLLQAERNLIDTAVNAGTEIAKFRALSKTDPKEAVEHLTSFGSLITEAFNHALPSVFEGRALHQLGALVMMAAASALDPSVQLGTDALLDVTVIGKELPDPVPAPEIAAADILAEQRASSFA